MSDFDSLMREAAAFAAAERAAGRDPALPPREQSPPRGGAVVKMPMQQDSLIYREDATPPFDAFDRLMRDRDFKRLWYHQRSDLSAEARDTELARFALRAGWTDQQIVDLVIYHHSENLEPLRLHTSYYRDLLTRAHTDTATDDAGGTVDQEAVEERLAALSRTLGITIAAIVKYGAVDGIYELQLVDGRNIDLGTAAHVLNQSHVRAKVLDATGSLVPIKSTRIWHQIAQRIVQAAGPAPVEEAPEEAEMRWHLSACVNEAMVEIIDERDRVGLAKILREAQGSGHWLFRNQDGRIMFRLGGLLRQIRINHGVLLGFKEAGKRLRKLGFVPQDLDGQDTTGRVCINVWAAPRGWRNEG